MKANNFCFFLLIIVSCIAACQNVKSIEDGADRRTLYFAFSAKITDSSQNPVSGFEISIQSVVPTGGISQNLTAQAIQTSPSYDVNSAKKFITDTAGIIQDAIFPFSSKKNNDGYEGSTTYKASFKTATSEITIRDIRQTKANPVDPDIALYDDSLGVASNPKIKIFGAIADNYEAVKKISNNLKSVVSGTGGSGSSGSTGIGCCTFTGAYSSVGSFSWSQTFCNAYGQAGYTVSYSPNACP